MVLSARQTIPKLLSFSRVLIQFWKQFVFYNATKGIVGTRDTTCVWKQSCIELIFRFSIGAKWRTCYQETGAGVPEKWQEGRDPLADPPFWLEDFTEPGGHRSACTRAHLSGLRFGTSYEVVTKSRKHSIETHFPKDRNCDVCLNQNDKGFLQKTTGKTWPRAEKFGDMITADHSLRRRMWIKRHSLARCRGARSCHSMGSILSVKNKRFTWDGKKFVEILGAVAKTESCIKRQLDGIWESMWSFIMDSPHFNTSSIRDMASPKELPGPVARWWSDSMECNCFLRCVQDFLADAKTSYERRFGEPFQRVNNTFWSNGWFSSDFPERSGKKVTTWSEWVLPWIFLGYELFEERIGKWDRLGRFGKVGCIRYLSSENQRRGSVYQTRCWTHFPNSRWYSKKYSGRDCEFRVLNLRREQTGRSEDFCGEIQGESGASQPAEPKPVPTLGRLKREASQRIRGQLPDFVIYVQKYGRRL